MKFQTSLIALAALFPLLASALDPAEERLGFVALADGKTFNGWKHDGNWEIQDGAFARVRPKGSLTYEAQLVPDDFELRFEWKVSPQCNSGVYYRPGQVEYQVLDDAHPVYGENPRQSAASIFFCMGPRKRATRPVGEWNTARIICKGSVIEHWLNEERVISFDYNDPKWAKEVELLRIRGGDLTGRGGKLLLQDHGQDVAFRSLRMRTIPASETLQPDPNFQPLPVPPAALAKEEARVRGMLEKAKPKPMTATSPQTADSPLWDERQKLAEGKSLPLLEGVEFRVIKKWDKPADGYTFLHGVGLAWHKGKLYASIGHNKGEENTVTEEAQYRVSDDDGRTWSELRAIDAGEEPDLAVSHGVFASHAGKLWAFHGAYYGRMQRIHTRAYSLDEATGRWVKHGVVVENGFWALNQPVKMSDGNWIMAGISAGTYSDKTTNPAAVAISHGDDFTKWDFVGISAPQGIKMWGESSIIVDGANVLNIARYGAKALALIAHSKDYGRNWTTMAESNLPMATSKPCSGLLSNGQRYLVCTTAANNGGRRAPLTIAVSRPGESVLSKVFVIRHAESSAGGESAARLSLSYPCATEHEGNLYVGYSNNGGRAGNLNSAELAIIPIKRLKAE